MQPIVWFCIGKTDDGDENLTTKKIKKKTVSLWSAPNLSAASSSDPSFNTRADAGAASISAPPFRSEQEQEAVRRAQERLARRACQTMQRILLWSGMRTATESSGMKTPTESSGTKSRCFFFILFYFLLIHFLFQASWATFKRGSVVSQKSFNTNEWILN